VASGRRLERGTAPALASLLLHRISWDSGVTAEIHSHYQDFQQADSVADSVVHSVAYYVW